MRSHVRTQGHSYSRLKLSWVFLLFFISLCIYGSYYYAFDNYHMKPLERVSLKDRFDDLRHIHTLHTMDNFTLQGLPLANKTLNEYSEREIMATEQILVNESTVSGSVKSRTQESASNGNFFSAQDTSVLNRMTESGVELHQQTQPGNRNDTIGHEIWSQPTHTVPLKVSAESVNGSKSELPPELLQVPGSQRADSLPMTETRVEYEYNRTTSMDAGGNEEVFDESDAVYEGEENEGQSFADFVDYNSGMNTEDAAGSIAEEEAPVNEQNNTEEYNFSAGEFGVVFSEPNSDDLDDVELEQMEPVDQIRYEVERGSSDMHNSYSGTQSSTDLSSAQMQSVPYAGVFPMAKVKFPALSTPATPGPPPVPDTANRRSIFVDLERLANYSKPYCNISSHFKSWETGMVTQMGIPITRDCRKLGYYNSRSEISIVKSQVMRWRATRPWEEFALKFKGTCDQIREEFLNNFYVSKVELDFPIAYIFVVYTNAGQVIRLLKSIYRPQNLYCIHPDKKQGDEFADFFKAISKCLDNVFVVSKPLSVYYAHHSIMDAQLNCMIELMRYPKRWKYVINLCGREVPLKTNREIVEALIKLKGYTALDNHHLTPLWRQRRFRFQYRLGPHGYMHQTRIRQRRPPYGIKIHKSMNFIAASQEFVKFILYSKRARALHNFLKTVYAPEEHFYSSLYALPYAKGGAPKQGEIDHDDMPRVDQFIWVANRYQTSHSSRLCPGRKVVHSICILTTPDVEKMEKNGIRIKRPFFFFNKYFLEWDPIPMDCMEERLVRTNIQEYRRDCLVGNFYIPSL